MTEAADKAPPPLYSITLDTADPDNERFVGYLEGAGIKAEKLGQVNNHVSVKYVGARDALLAMFRTHFSSNDPASDSDMLSGILPEPLLMSPADRTTLLDQLFEQAGSIYADERQNDLVETAMEFVRDGVRGLVERTDDELLDEAGSDYSDEEGNFIPGTEPDPTDNEIFRLWAKYRKPELLCPTCEGRGFSPTSGAVDCPTCNGSGLEGQALLPLFRVVASRQIEEYCGVRASTAKEAAAVAKLLDGSQWKAKDSDRINVKVFAGSNESGEPLYQE